MFSSRRKVSGMGPSLLADMPVLHAGFLLNFREMIIGVTQRIVDLRGGEVRKGLPDGLHGFARLRPLIHQADRNAGAHNDGIAPADRTIFMNITVLGFHSWFLRPPSESARGPRSEGRRV